MSKKTYLLILGVVLVLMGIGGMVPGWTIATEPIWHAIVKVAVGAYSIYVAYNGK